MKKIFIVFVLTLFISKISISQSNAWQQRVNYNIAVKLDAAINLLNGTQKVDYWNNSPDTLQRIFIHLYWNAFQPNSSMDVRSRELGQIYMGKNKKGEDVYDWDTRVKDRISKLKADEMGYQHVQSLSINGKLQQLKIHETILEVVLDKPLLPKSKTTLDIVFEAQVPVQIRRSGRNNAEGIGYSMSQWYPKIVEYDKDGWHPTPYIAREFYGVWGDYDVKISIDKKYMVAATGVFRMLNRLVMDTLHRV